MLWPSPAPPSTPGGVSPPWEEAPTPVTTWRPSTPPPASPLPGTPTRTQCVCSWPSPAPPSTPGEIHYHGRHVTRNHLAAIDSPPATPLPGTQRGSSIVYALAVSGSTSTPGENFHSIGGVTRNHLAAIDTSTGIPTSWNPNASSTSTLWPSPVPPSTSGNSPPSAALTRNRLAAIDASTGIPTSWDPNAKRHGLLARPSPAPPSTQGGVHYPGRRHLHPQPPGGDRRLHRHPHLLGPQREQLSSVLWPSPVPPSTPGGHLPLWAAAPTPATAWRPSMLQPAYPPPGTPTPTPRLCPGRLRLHRLCGGGVSRP